MFRSQQNYRTFLTILMTYTLDLVGYSIVFPVLAPLLLNSHLHFFAPDTLETTRTTMLGVLFAVFGLSQFIAGPFAGALADHYGRYKIFLWSIALSIGGYSVMAIGVYKQSLELLFLGRMITGFCSGNVALAQSATADLTDEHNRSKAFGVLVGVGGLGFVAGPWFGGKLANPNWLFGSGAFIFAAVCALINFFVVLFFFTETATYKKHDTKSSFFNTFKDIRLVFHQKKLRNILATNLLFSIGWGFFLIFSPTFLEQKYFLGADKIGDIFAFMAVVWFFVSMFLNKELSGKFSVRSLILAGIGLSSFGVGTFLYPNQLWYYWIIIPITLTGGALSWVNLSAILSLKASEQMQGRAMGAAGSMWAIGQIVSPLLAGPLAGLNMHLPLLVGSIILFISFIYFFVFYHEK
ncbi:MAG: MFS transporter [Chlamydiales bacterium]|nr:MFS transporter [Chlamydiales bacterium]